MKDDPNLGIRTIPGAGKTGLENIKTNYFIKWHKNGASSGIQ